MSFLVFSGCVAFVSGILFILFPDFLIKVTSQVVGFVKTNSSALLR
jgi:uncharacterized membrane protein HdeD (DUF308 family)